MRFYNHNQRFRKGVEIDRSLQAKNQRGRVLVGNKKGEVERRWRTGER